MRVHRGSASLLLVALLSALALPSALAIKPRQHGECLVTDEFDNPSVPTFKHFFIQSPDREDGSRTVNVTVAEDFKVEYYDHFKVVRNLKEKTSYVLYHCGRERPAEEDLPTDLQNATNPSFNKFFPVPLNRVSVPDTTAFAFLKALGLEERISFVSQFTVDACASKLFEEGDGACNKRSSYSSFDPSKNGMVDEVDAILTSGEDEDNEKVIAFTATSDPGVLNRAEWVKFMATFFNKEAEANELFNQIATDYNNTKEKIAGHLDSANAERPLIAWLYYQSAQNFPSFSSPSKVELKFAPYLAHYMQDMGGRMLDFDSIRSKYVNGTNILDATTKIEFVDVTDDIGATLSEILQDVDFIIDDTSHDFVSSTPDDAEIGPGHVADVFRLTGTTEERVRNGSLPIIRHDASKNTNGGTNWLQDAVPFPNQVLNEFARVLWGNQLDFSLSTSNSLGIVRQLGKGEVSLVRKEQCKQGDYDDCTLTSDLICPMLYIDCDGTVKAATTEQRCPPTVSECEAREGTSTSTLDLTFEMNSEYADKIVANSLEDMNSTTFESTTVKKIKSALDSVRGADSSVTSTAVRLIGVVEAPAASKRRVLLDSHKTIKVSYAVIVQGGDSNQAVKDVHNVLSTLTAEGASFWGPELDDFSIMSSAATSAQHPDTQDGSRPALKQTLSIPFNSADQASTFARTIGTIRLSKGEVYSTVGRSANSVFAHEYLQSALDGASEAAEDGKLEATADGSTVTLIVHIYYSLSDSELYDMESNEVTSITNEIFGDDEDGRADDTRPNPSSGNARKLLAVVSQLYQNSIVDSGGTEFFNAFKDKARSSGSFSFVPTSDDFDGARSLRAGVLTMGAAALLSAFALLA